MPFVTVCATAGCVCVCLRVTSMPSFIERCANSDAHSQHAVLRCECVWNVVSVVVVCLCLPLSHCVCYCRHCMWWSVCRDRILLYVELRRQPYMHTARRF